MTKLPTMLEARATELCNVSFKGLTDAQIGEKIEGIVAGLSDSEADAVIERASELKKQEAADCFAEADGLQALQRLLRMPGCPKGDDAFPWLIERTGHPEARRRVRRPQARAGRSMIANQESEKQR